MKNISTLIVMMTLICHSQLYSQSNFKKYREYRKLQKMYDLKVEDIKSVQKVGKTSWTAKTTLTNNSRDTLFYFSAVDCEPSYYMIGAAVDSIQLYSDFKPCNVPIQTVIAIPPKGQRIVNLEISSLQPVTSSFDLTVYLSINKAKNIGERIADDMLTRGKNKDRKIFLVSSQIKVKTPAGNSNK